MPALSIFGLSSVSILSSEYPLRGLLSALLGLTLSTIGLDLISGVQRFTFGIPSLFDGLLPLVLAGPELFALPEAIVLLTEKHAGFQVAANGGDKIVWLRWREFTAVFPTMVLGTALGFVMGLIPGLAGSVPPWISYNLARLISRERERFGKGAPGGIVAPEATNAAVMHATLLPAFSFGIPGTPTSAVILGAMMLSGLTPGPMLFAEHPDIPYAVFVSLFFATVFLWIVGLVATNFWVRLLYGAAGAAGGRGHPLCRDRQLHRPVEPVRPATAIAAGIIGCIMKKAQFSAPALVVGFILGPIIETNLRRSLLLSGGAVGGMPGALTLSLLILSAIMLVLRRAPKPAALASFAAGLTRQSAPVRRTGCGT